MVDYSERLSLAMDKVGVEVRQLSDALDATYQAVKKVVDGKPNAFNAANNARAAQFLNVNSNWLALGVGSMDRERGEAMLPAIPSEPLVVYTRLEHLPYRSSMGAGRAYDGDLVVQHLDVLDSFIKQKVSLTNSSRINLLTGIGQSMMPAIQDHEIVFVDIEHKQINVAGYYVIDVGGLLLLKKP